MVLAAISEGATAAVPRRIVVAGLPGSGKTALVMALCASEAILDSFEGGVLWLSLGPAPDLAALKLELYRALITPTAAPAAATVQAELQQRLRDRKVLLVLEDARDAAAVRELAGLAPRAVVVVTTRDSAVLVPPAAAAGADIRDGAPVSSRPAESTTRILSVGPMRADEAGALLAAHVEGTSGAPTPAATAQLAEALGNLPLALTLAGAQLRERARGAEPGDIAGELDRLTGTLNRRQFELVTPEWREEVLLPVAKAVRETLAAISPEDRRRLEQWAREGEPVTTAGQLARLWSVTEAEVEALVRRLSTRSLVAKRADGRCERSALASAVLLAGESTTAVARSDQRPSGSELRRENPDVALANRVLAGQALPATDLRDLAKRLRGKRIFDLARRVLALARTQADARSDPSLMTLLTQQQALCTYRDRDLEAGRRFDWALQILGELGPLDASTDPETLGLAGAVHKNRWLLDGQPRHLEHALAAYRRGFAQGIDRDNGYTGINAAFVHDLLAWEAAQAANGSAATRASSTDSEHAREARRIREQIALRLPEIAEAGRADLAAQWWFCATVAEACFGLGRYDDALAWIRRGQASPVDAWEHESTARQLAWLARIQHQADPDTAAAGAAQNVLRAMIGADPTALAGLFLGKVGLALSGGGFRASLFHIGVLARLADLDLLRHVEVLSCVSGGSIVGAHYYLKIRALLKAKSDAEIKRDDYQRLVAELIDEFLAGVQENIRLRVMANPVAALRMALSPDYSRTDRLGELYERHLYARVADGEASAPRFISDLTIAPKGEPDSFAPESDNWRRGAKAPVLVLNATSLNTAHNWQFTATWMGEPPDLLTTEIDANPRLARLYYWEAPERHRKVRLGAAVAASSCVPALFEPLSLPGLYPERRVQLVDGGVHDNQGLSALVESQCVVALVSDASGQTSEVLRPGTGMLGVLKRSNGILQARVREASLRDLLVRARSGLVRGLMFLHLKRDLAADPVGHKGRLERPEAPGASTGVRGVLTSYGILREVQHRLAAIRTDLDAFSDAEAFALMLSGYRMAQADLAVALRGLPGAAAHTEGPAGTWRFLAIEPAATGAAGSERAVAHLQEVLGVGRSIGFKPWMLRRDLAIASGAALATLLVGAGLALWYLLPSAVPSWPRLALWITAGVAAVVFGVFGLLRLRGSCKSLSQIVLGLALAAGGWLIVRLHLAQLDGLYLRAGRLPSEPDDDGPRPAPAAAEPSAVASRAAAPPRSAVSRLSQSPALGALLLLVAALAGIYGIFWWNQQRTASQLTAEAARLARLGRGSDAEAIYRTALAEDPSQSASIGLARLLLRKGEMAEAEARLDGLRITDPWTLADRAYARRSNGHYEGALADYDAALAADPQNVDWVRGRAYTLALSRRTAEAINTYAQAIAIQPDVRSLMDRASLLVSAGRLTEALADYRAALKLRAADPDILAAAAAVERSLAGQTTRPPVPPDTTTATTGPPPDVTVTTPPSTLEARLYVTVATKDQAIAVQALGPALADAGLRLANVTIAEAAGTELRYVAATEYPEAMRIADLFDRRCLPVGDPKAGRAGASRPRHFELAIGAGTRVPSPREFASGQCAAAGS
jgi:predicted acylesterase/phospholipase RssA/tetratricopeptide (TPR) repeat protein